MRVDYLIIYKICEKAWKRLNIYKSWKVNFPNVPLKRVQSFCHS